MHESALPSESALPAILTSDNRRSAGTLANGVLTLQLRAGVGMWRPEGDAGPALRIEAFGEGDSPLAIPSPLIRVPEGTEIAASIVNGLVHPMRVHGLCDRSADACPPIDLAPGETRSVRFRSGPAGTYHYWATTTGMPLPFRAADDTQLSGAFIVDAAGARPDADRVFVITDWTALTRQQLAALVTLDDPGAAFLAQKTEVKLLVNGRSWPHTERLSYDLAEPVRWRLVNLSTQAHPMHLHGFHYEVDSLGDGRRDQAFPAGRKPSVVTQVMQPGSTMGMTWVPQRPGNWLFHCHLMTHVSPSLHVDGSARPGGAHGAAHHEGAGMTGLVLGVTVRGHEEQTSGGDETTPWTTRGIRLVMESQAGRFGDAPAYGFALDGERDPRSGGVPVPGPTLVLRRGERVEITLVNRLPEATAIHWHGMELDSYYDGVHGWSGQGSRLSPLVEPGGSFVVRFTPPRAGTFMYHTHLHERRQLTSGLYGAMLVLDPDETYDEATDHVFVIGRGGPQLDAPVVINGQASPTALWKAGARHRVRFVNITPDDNVSITLQTSGGPVTWRKLAKDGAALPPDLRESGPASQPVGVGETFDFEYDAPPGRRTVWLDVRSPAGKWLAQGRIIVK